MASKQNIREEERAEAPARVAASELSDDNRERREGHEEQTSPGVIKSLLKTVQGTLGNAKEAVTGRAHETAEVTGEGTNAASDKAKESKDTASQKAGVMTEKAKDKTVGKAGEYEDYAAEQARETKDAAMQKAGEYKDYAAEKAKEGKDLTSEKAGEYKDYTAEKTKEGKDTTVGKMTEPKDSAADAAKRAMGFLTGKKEETKEKAAETAQVTKDKLGQTEEAARRNMEDLKTKEDEAKQRAEATDRESRTDRGSGGLLGALGSVKDSIKEKLSVPTTGTGHESQAAREQHERSGSGEGKIVVGVEEISPAEATAETLKAADKMSGQTFNDVGRLAEEGAVVAERKDRQRKM